MTVRELAQNKGFAALNATGNEDAAINGGMCCDLLSWAMANGQEGMAWVTVQTHMNVVAVAALHDMACIILAHNNVMPPEVLAKATQEGISVVQSALTAFEVCGILHENGVR